MAETCKDQLINYFKKNISKGYPVDSLKIALMRQGYSSAVIQRAIQKVNEEIAKEVPKFKEKPKIKYELVDPQNQPVIIKKSFFERFFGL